MTTWALKDVLFVIDYRVFTMQEEGQQCKEKTLNLVSKIANEKSASSN